jgi:signal transduction histidine kinase
LNQVLSGLQEKLDDMIALAFLRVLQEGMHNAMKHSGAKGITVRLTRSDHDLALEIKDDGVGFDVEGARGLRRDWDSSACANESI